MRSSEKNNVFMFIAKAEEDLFPIFDYISSGYEVISSESTSRFIVYFLKKPKK